MIETSGNPILAGLKSGAALSEKNRTDVTAEERAAMKAGEEFEALFIAEMLGPVFEGLKSDGMFGGGSGEEIYRSLMVQEYGKAIARSGGIGIAETVQREMLKMQEMQS
ncbi:chemotaxis protein chel [Pelagibius litoralis]|uniref:Chemotaxis protein chel n=1 Tax=Pelagibius litoralis TaxID=374515 RepID=A0A967EY03_9PROT|nr:rod-binding protein [Pelagibius litoralis]NIA69459.1 chemotaxis protein chel [Pelagibius litoralis]